MWRICFITLLLSVATFVSTAQVEGDSLALPGETVMTGTAVVSDSGVKSPLGAVVRSAIIPGWGQFYNEAYWKVPIVLGLTGFLVYGIVQEHERYIEYRDRYALSITEELPVGNLRHKQFREFYRNRRDTYAWWTFITYLFQIADAFVDAHLFSFDVDDVNALSLLPTNTGIGIQLRF